MYVELLRAERALSDDEPEQALVARAIQGDTEAFGRLYGYYFERIYRFVRLRVGNQSDATDITHDVFLKALRSINRFSPRHEASFEVWLFTLARNTLIDGWRRPPLEVPFEALIDEPPAEDTASNPEKVADWHVTLEELQRALASLTEEQRAVISLRFFVGLSAREVGTILSKQEGTVRGIQFRALAALGRALHRIQGR
jgi:RNA polymerase sigma-70 factor (ECF subfamily)